MIEITPKIIWIDHHISAIEKFARKAPFIYLQGLRSTKHCAATLAMKLLSPNINQRPNLFLQLVEDWDLHKGIHGDITVNFALGMSIHPSPHPYQYFLRDTLFAEKLHAQNIVQNIAREGKSIATFLKNETKNHLFKQCTIQTLIRKPTSDTDNNDNDQPPLPTTITLYLLNYNGSATSFIADTLKELIPEPNAIIAIFSIQDDNTVKVELRKKELQNLNLANIATQLDGGGHQNAAGFIIKLQNQDQSPNITKYIHKIIASTSQYEPVANAENTQQSPDNNTTTTTEPEQQNPKPNPINDWENLENQEVQNAIPKSTTTTTTTTKKPRRKYVRRKKSAK